jgi:hypothetical protein
VVRLPLFPPQSDQPEMTPPLYARETHRTS